MKSTVLLLRYDNKGGHKGGYVVKEVVHERVEK